MDSTIFNRRTLLGSGALLGLGALLAACGQQANNEAAATASAVPSSRLRLPMPLLHQLLRARSSPAATRAARRHPTANTAKLTVMVPRKMFLFRKPSRSSTPQPLPVSGK